MLKPRSAILLLHLTSLAAASWAGQDDDWFDPAYLEANTINGGTGFIQSPSPEIIPAGVLSASIHRFQFKFDYGLWDRVELGLSSNLQAFDLKDGWRNILFFGRLRVLDAERFGLGLSVGAEGIGPEDLGGSYGGYIPKPELEAQENFYGVLGGVLPFYKSLMLSAGIGMGAKPWHFFANASKVVFPGLMAMIEYDGEGTNLGGRLLLSPRVKLDLDFLHTQDIDPSQPFARVLERNIYFGITYSEPWPARSGKD